MNKLIEIQEKNKHYHMSGFYIKETLSYLKVSGYKFPFMTMAGSSNDSLIIHRFFILELDVSLFLVSKSPDLTRFTRKIIFDLRVALRKNTFLKKLSSNREINFFDRDQLSKFNKSPLEHQTEYFNFYERMTDLLNLKGLSLPGPPGSGKTLMSLMMHAMSKNDVCIVICLNSLVKTVWEETITTEIKGKSKVWTSLDKKPFTSGNDYYILHYEYMGKIINSLGFLQGKTVSIILDESHYVNETGTDRFKNFSTICDRLDSRMILWASGTPIKALGSEVVALLSTISEDFKEEEVRKTFIKTYGSSSNRRVDILNYRLKFILPKVKKPEYTNHTTQEDDILIKLSNGDDFTLDAIREKMRSFIQHRVDFYSKHKKDFLDTYNKCLKIHEEKCTDTSELERYKRAVNKIVITKNRQLVYEEMKFCNNYEKDYIIPDLPNNLKDPFREAKSVVKYVDLKIRGEALGQVLASERIKCINELAKEFDLKHLVDNSIKKTLIFTSNVETVTIVAERAKRLGYKPAVVYGEIKADIQKTRKALEEDPKLNPLCTTYKSLSTGVPLYMANTIILLDQPYRAYIKEQTIARADRLGQDTQVFVFNIILDTGEKENISSRSMDILKWSVDQIDRLLNQDSPITVELVKSSLDDDYLERLLKRAFSYLNL